MNTSALVRCGRTLVVFDGPRRLSWHASRNGDYTPTALWPSPAQAAEVLDHLYGGGCLLVLIEQRRTSVPMFAEEAERLPQDIAARTTLTGDGVLSELHLPVLDWMPDPLRERGLRFLEHSAEQLLGMPDLLLPQLLVEEPPHRPDNLRFARPRTARPFADGRMEPVTDRLFTLPPTALPTCPVDSAPGTVHTWETTS